MYTGERHYVMSGSLTTAMVEKLITIPTFEPIDVLVSQLDRAGVNKMLEYMEMGAVKSLFIDSGAYSIHAQGFEKVAKGRFATIDEFIDEYIEYVNELDDKIIAVAQVDHIPGVFRQPKTPQDYIESTELSWENFMYMYPKMKSPEKLIAVMHQGESFDYLRKLANWRGDHGEKIEYLGISPSNDRGVNEKDIYLKEVYDCLQGTTQPDIRTHLFGYTSLPGLEKFPWYSVDSTSHRLRPAYNKVFVREFGTISLSRKRETTTKTDQMFLEVADKENIKLLEDRAKSYNLTLDELENESWARTVFDIMEVSAFVKEHPYNPKKLGRRKRLFNID